LALLLNSALLFNGCRKNVTYFSVGLAAPCAELGFPNNSLMSANLISVSPVCCAINVAAVLLLIWLSLKRQILFDVLASRRFFFVVLMTVLLFNSFLAVPPVWEYGVFSPTLRIFGALDWIFSAEGDVEKLLIIISSRLYFVMCLLFGYSAVRFGHAAFRRYVFIEPDRWWQFKLGGLLTMMVVFGAGIGLLVRLFMN
jgi:hypothetical protein